jgi:ketosteroid isomerase-like protein
MTRFGPIFAAILSVMRKILFLISTFWILLSPVSAQEQRSDTEVNQFLARFIRAFDNLDWEGFRQSFSDDATVFYPRAIPERANGRAEFEKNFKVVFEQIRAGRKTPPYMDIQPRGMATQLFGDIAIVTFHLDDRVGFVNRRTIVIERTPAGWKIVHLHASEVAVEP